MRIPAKGNKVLRGVAGEYYVAAELSRMGFIASLTLRNTRGIDILASNPDATKSVGIQVKTTFGSQPVWILSKQVEEDVPGGLAQNLCYVFVSIPSIGHAPVFHVVRRSEVVDYCRRTHEAYISEPGKLRKDSNMRKFRDLDGAHINAWSVLGLGDPSG